MKVYYYDGIDRILIGTIITNRSLTIEEALDILDFDEYEFCLKYDLVGVDYDDFILVY